MLSAQQANDSQVQRLLNWRQVGLKFPETRAEKFHSLVLQVRIRKLSHQYEQQFRVLWRGDAVYGLQVLQIRVAQLRVVPVTAPQGYKSHNDKQQNAHECADPHESRGFQRRQWKKRAQKPVAQKQTRPHQDPDHNRKDKPRILYSHLRRGRSTEIPRQQDGAKNGGAGIEIRPQADKLNDANVDDDP